MAPLKVYYFLGAYISCAITSYALITIIIALVAFIFAWTPTRDFLLNDLRWLWVPLITVTVFDIVFRMIVAKQFYDVDTKTKAVSFKHRLAFNFFAFAEAIAMLPASTLRALMRVFYGLVYLCLQCLRVDYSILPDDWTSFDTPFASFASVVIDDESRSSPLFLAAASSFIPGRKSKLRPAYLRVRNRFWLAAVLHSNPSLIEHRGHFLAELSPQEENDKTCKVDIVAVHAQSKGTGETEGSIEKMHDAL